MKESQEIQAFAQELTAAQRRLYLYILALVHQPQDAEDILQETNRVLWEKCGQFELGTNFAAWSQRVAFNEIRTYRKRAARESLRFQPALLEQLADEGAQMFEEVDTRREAMRACLAKLTESDQAMISARYEDQRAASDIARQQGRRLNSIHRSLARIRQALLACIERAMSTEGRG
jgi:RNA polymerase sigma-70 factor (ECF subfamily)